MASRIWGLRRLNLESQRFDPLICPVRDRQNPQIRPLWRKLQQGIRKVKRLTHVASSKRSKASPENSSSTDDKSNSGSKATESREPEVHPLICPVRDRQNPQIRPLWRKLQQGSRKIWL